MLKISVYVPSESGGELIDTDKRWRVLRYVTHRLSEEFGGCTSIEGYGWWTNSKGELIAEHVTIVYSLVSDGDVTSVLYELAEYVKDTLNQDSVLTTIEPVTQINFI